MAEEDEPDYDAIWQQISRIAGDAKEEAERQARWFEEAGRYFDPDLAHAAQRRASKAWISSIIQQYDLADAINKGDIAGYIQRWHPVNSPQNGSRIVYVHYDEIELISLPAWTAGSESRPPTVGWEDNKLADTHKTRQTSASPVSIRIIRYGVLALGRILSLFDSSRGSRRQLRRRDRAVRRARSDAPEERAWRHLRDSLRSHHGYQIVMTTFWSLVLIAMIASSLAIWTLLVMGTIRLLGVIF